MAIEDGEGWKGNPHPSFGGERNNQRSLCIFWHKAELTSRRKWWRSSLVHGAFNGLILRPNFISFPESFSPFFNYPAHFVRLLSTGIRVINYQSASTLQRRVNCKCNRDFFGKKKRRKERGRGEVEMMVEMRSREV